MKLKAVAGMVLTALLVGVLMLTFNVQQAEAAEPPATEWIRTFGGAENDHAHSVVQTSDGGYAIAGFTESFGAENGDFWLIKVDSSGNHQWNKTYGGAGGDVARSVVETSDGGYALAGYTQSFGPGYNDFWLVKVDSSGNAQWNKTCGSAEYSEWAYSMVETSDGGYALAGDTGSEAGDSDFCLVKVAPYIRTSVTVGGQEYPILIEGNVTITDLATNIVALHFNASGPPGQTGYINVTLPVELNQTAIKVFINGNKLTPPPFPTITTNSTHYFIYLEFTTNTDAIIIQYGPGVGGVWIPVDKLALLAPYIALASTILVATAATAIYVKRRKKKQ